MKRSAEPLRSTIMAARLKVFCWSDGLHAYTVATSSRAKALAAWGFNRDLFKDGEAKEIKAGADHDRALASPGVTVKRGLGASAGEVEDFKPAAPRRQPTHPKKLDLERVAKLEAELTALARDEAAKTAEIEREQQALDGKKARLSKSFEARRTGLDARLRAARAKAGSR
jgi:hypothetical protein